MVPKADEIKSALLALTVTAVIVGAVPLAADYVRLSPAVAGVVSYADFFRALPLLLPGLWLFGLAVVLFAIPFFVLLLPFRKPLAAGLAVVFVLVLMTHRESWALDITALDIWRIALLLLFAALTASLLLLKLDYAAPIACGSTVVGVILWFYATWFPLAATPLLTDEICVESECFQTDIVRIYDGWLLHQRSPDRLEFRRMDAVSSFAMKIE